MAGPDVKKMLEHRVGLPPVVGQGPKVLVLGTIPSVLSDDKQEYYGNPQNHFWKVIYGVFDSEPDPDYKARLVFLKGKHLALWDVLKECDIDGSKDHTIIDPVPNNIESLLRKHNSISHVFINGKKALELYEELIQDSLPRNRRHPMVVALTSTSTANPISLPNKIAAWKVAFEAL
jgi:hypoxanthine-DNA glycosylase